MEMERLFRQSLERNRFFCGGETVLVGISGGPDSVGLLSLLRAVSGEYRLCLRAAHFNHGIRPQAEEEETFVRQLCDGWEIPLITERADVPKIAAERRQGIEETARDLRRSFLQQVAAENECDLIALGHHGDDQAETVLHRLIRGSGPTGLAAMRPSEGGILRPLLLFSHSQILDYLHQKEIPFVNDDSNRDCRFTRNRIRHQLLPMLREFNPRIEEQLGRLAELFSCEEDYWRQETDKGMAEVGRKEGDRWCIDLTLLREYPVAFQRRLLRRFLEDLRQTPLALSWGQFEALQKIIVSSNPHAETVFPGGWAGRDYHCLFLAPECPICDTPYTLALESPGEMEIPGVGHLFAAVAEGCGGESRWTVEFDAARVAFPLILRSVRAGDRFRPAGLAGSKKLKDLFIDMKIARPLRRRIPLVVAAGEILWVAGIRRSSHFWPDLKTARVLRLRFRPDFPWPNLPL